jgi:DNA replication protein DnaC
MRVKMIDGDPSWLDSWLLWRKFSTMGGGVSELFRDIGYQFPQPFYQFLEKYEGDICPFCNGWGEINDPNHGRAYCLCMVLQWQQDMDKQMAPFESYLAPADLTDLVATRGNAAQKQATMTAVETTRLWMVWPRKWMVLTGPNGVGKTTLMASIRKELPIAKYVTAYDFEQQMYRGQGDGTFDHYLELLGQVPILLFDDWGAEYGKTLIHAKASAVIDKRDRVWQELITVVATNLALEQFKSYNERMGSRLANLSRTEWVNLVTPDYRLGKP